MGLVLVMLFLFPLTCNGFWLPQLHHICRSGKLISRDFIRAVSFAGVLLYYLKYIDHSWQKITIFGMEEKQKQGMRFLKGLVHKKYADVLDYDVGYDLRTCILREYSGGLSGTTSLLMLFTYSSQVQVRFASGGKGQSYVTEQNQIPKNLYYGSTITFSVMILPTHFSPFEFIYWS